MSSQIVTEDVISSLTQELAEGAGITPEQASKVLSIMHLDKLDENMVAINSLLHNEQARNALGISNDEAKARLRVTTSNAVRLDNLRLGIKPAGVFGILV